MLSVCLELADKLAWIQHGYSKNFQKFWQFQDNADRIDESNMTIEEFVEKYEKPYKPVIIRGVQNGWRAQHKWTIEVGLCIMILICTIKWIQHIRRICIRKGIL